MLQHPDGLHRFAFLTRLGGVILLLCLIATLPLHSAQATDPQEPPTPARNSTSTYLPLLSTPFLSAVDTFPIGSEGGTFTALNGRVTLNFPEGAVNYLRCVLHVETDNLQAAELALKITIPCQIMPDEAPYYYSDFKSPVTITMDYAKVDLTYTDELRLGILYGESATQLAAGDVSSALAVDDLVVDPAAKTVSGKINAAGTYRLGRNYTFVDLNDGPGGAFAAAPPFIYTALPGGKLDRYLNLDEIDPAGDRMHGFNRFAVNPNTGEMYLALAGKLAGSAVNVVAVKASSLRTIYQVPDGEMLWDLTYRPGDNLLYLSMTKDYGSWYGCPLRHVWVRVIKPGDGSVVGDDLSDGTGINRGLIGLTVDSKGYLLAGAYDPGCSPGTYSGATLVAAQSNTPSALLNRTYPGFRGIADLASGVQGRTYIANSTANMVSVVSGAPSEVIGAIEVTAPSRIAVSGDTLYVLSNGKIITRSATTFTGGGTVTLLPSTTLSASDLNIQGNRFLLGRACA